MTSRPSPLRRLAALAAICWVVLALAGCSDASDSDAEDPTTTAANPEETALTARAVGDTVARPEAFFGFNGASIVQTINVDLLLDDELQELLADFPTRLIRVPTGTAAQWIDWRTGRFIDDPTSPFASIPDDRRGVTMTDWADLVQASGATPVWDLNVLNATLEDQLEMLNEAVRLGMDVDYIELGNELWDVRSIYPEVYPSGTAYAETMNTWIPTLRERFPDAQIAVSGADPSDEFFLAVFGDRYRTWNDEVLATIEGADAIAIHPYWTLPERADPGSDVEATLTVGLQRWDEVTATTLDAVPDDMDVWVTEWNQAAWGSDAGTQIWAQALSVTAVALAHLSTGQITMSLVHNIVDGAPNPHDAGISVTFPVFTNGVGGSEPLERTGLGHALPLVFDAVAPGTRAQLLVVDGAPTNGPHQGVVGVRLTGAGEGALFVNLTGEDCTVSLPGDMEGTWQVTTLTAAPDAEPGWKPDEAPTRTETAASSTVAVPAYSIVRLLPG